VRRKSMIILLFLGWCAIGLGVSCNSDDDDERFPGIYGQVVDSEGQPIVGAKIHLGNFLDASSQPASDPGVDNEIDKTVLQDDELYQNFPNPFDKETTLRFTVSFRNSVRITFLDWTGEKELIELINETFDMGLHTRTIREDLTANIYRCLMQAASYNGYILVCIDRPVDEIDDDTPYFKITDENGEFYINSADELPLGETIIETDESEPEEVATWVVSSTMDLICFDSRYQTATQTVEIDRTQAIDAVFQMTTVERNP